MKSYDRIYNLLVEGKPPTSGAVPAFEKQSKVGAEQYEKAKALTKRAKETEEFGGYSSKLLAAGMKKVAARNIKASQKNLKKAFRSHGLIPKKK